MIESCIAGNDEIMDKILPKSDINAQNDEPHTALHEAIVSGSLKCVQKLLNTGKCDLNITAGNPRHLGIPKFIF